MIKSKKLLLYCVQLIARLLNKNLYYILRVIISFIMILIVICHISKFKQATKVFINSYAFGHSIIETTAFFFAHRDQGICISIGDRKNRNKYFKDLYKPYSLIHFWLPNLGPIKLNQAFRYRTHVIISNLLNYSPLIRLLLNANLEIIDRDAVLDKAVHNYIINNYAVTKEKALHLINNFKSDYIRSSNTHSSSLAYLMQIKNLINFNLTPRLRKSNYEFFEKLKTFQLEPLNGRPKVCTLILRKSKKRWSGMGYEGYKDVINYLNEKKYIVNLIGDTKGWRKRTNQPKLINVHDHLDYGLKSNLFQILSVMNSNFCLGDVSGAQTISHFFGQKNLILNVIPPSQLQYNSMILPQIWKSNLGLVASVSMHFNLIFNRFKPLMLPSGEVFYPHFNDPEIVLEAVKHFVGMVENNESFPSNSYINTGYKDSITKFAVNSSISPAFFRNFNLKSEL